MVSGVSFLIAQESHVVLMIRKYLGSSRTGHRPEFCKHFLYESCGTQQANPPGGELFWMFWKFSECSGYVVEVFLTFKNDRVPRQLDWIVALLDSNPGVMNDTPLTYPHTISTKCRRFLCMCVILWLNQPVSILWALKHEPQVISSDTSASWHLRKKQLSTSK